MFADIDIEHQMQGSINLLLLNKCIEIHHFLSIFTYKALYVVVKVVKLLQKSNEPLDESFKLIHVHLPNLHPSYHLCSTTVSATTQQQHICS